MSTDESVTKELIETLQDGKAGFAAGAEKLTKDGVPELAATFRQLSDQRDTFSGELQALADRYGDQLEEKGTVAATFHRGWMSLKDALTGSDPKAVLQTALQGEQHAVTEYEKALGEDISAELRAVVERQASSVRAAQQQLLTLAADR